MERHRYTPWKAVSSESSSSLECEDPGDDMLPSGPYEMVFTSNHDGRRSPSTIDPRRKKNVKKEEASGKRASQRPKSTERKLILRQSSQEKLNKWKAMRKSAKRKLGGRKRAKRLQSKAKPIARKSTTASRRASSGRANSEMNIEEECECCCCCRCHRCPCEIDMEVKKFDLFAFGEAVKEKMIGLGAIMYATGKLLAEDIDEGEQDQ